MLTFATDGDHPQWPRPVHGQAGQHRESEADLPQLLRHAAILFKLQRIQ